MRSRRDPKAPAPRFLVCVRASLAMALRALKLPLLCAVLASPLAACRDDGQQGGNGGGRGGGTGLTGLGGLGGNAFNQCGVAAPLPTEAGHCTAVGAPALADFDDY